MIILILMAIYYSHIVVHRCFVRIDLQALIMIDYLNSEVAASSRISCLTSYMIILANGKSLFLSFRYCWSKNRILAA